VKWVLEVILLCGQMCLGKQGENLARIVYFNEFEQWKDTFGEGTCEVLHQRNGDESPYPVALEIEDGKVCWKITNADTAVVGDGQCELRYIVDDVVVKSKILVTTVLPSLGDDVAEPPEPQKSWVDQVLEAADKVESATTHQPTIGKNNNWFIWDAEREEYIDSGVCAAGGGEGGQTGQDGGYYIPNIEQVDANTAKVSFKPSKHNMDDVADVNLTLPQGEKGEQGVKGEQGEPGHTPVKGVDYYTESDKQEIVSDVLASLPNASGVSF
jgi:hypothetical protein